MAFLHLLSAPHSLDINDSNVAENWSEWKEMWEHHSVASKVNKEEVFKVASYQSIDAKSTKWELHTILD